MTMNKSYKDYHAQLMHSSGTSAYETMIVILPSFFYTLIASLLTSLLFKHPKKSKKYEFLLDFFVIIIPVILNISILTKYIKMIIATLLVVIVSLLFLILSLKSKKRKPVSEALSKSYVTNVRATINLITVIAILAVDFRIFPRRFAKTETFGFSLMDVGVGLFMFSNGIVAPEVQGKKDSIKKSLKSSLVLLVLGGARLFLTNQTDYNVPVSEYGVHWNFFITLAITKILISFILNVVKVKYIYINAVFLMFAHEVLLETGLKSFVFADTGRDNFVKANKEGLVSSVGYVSLYLFSLYFGYFIDIKNKQDKLKTNLKFCFLSILCLFLTFIVNDKFSISRRLANSAYCFWILFIGIFMMWLFYLGENIQQKILRNKLNNCVCSPFILEAINYNGLVFFLTGNVLTGCVNMCLNTLDVDSVIGLLIIVPYMFVNCSIVCFLYYKQIKLQL